MLNIGDRNGTRRMEVVTMVAHHGTTTASSHYTALSRLIPGDTALNRTWRTFDCLKPQLMTKLVGMPKGLKDITLMLWRLL